MSTQIVPVITFFNNKGGVGKTSLVYHVASMLGRLGHTVVAADLDPQANLTSAFLDEDTLDSLWPAASGSSPVGSNHTIFDSLRPLIRGVGDITAPHLVDVDESLSLIPGDISLSSFEDDLSSEWSGCLDGRERSFRIISAFWRLLQEAGRMRSADLIVVDVGPNLGAINRSALVATDHVIIPLAPDLFSVQGLQNLGPTLRRWREEWQARRSKSSAADLELPAGEMRPRGYLLLQHGIRLGRPVRAYERWMDRIPGVYRDAVLGIDTSSIPPIAQDPYCLGQLKHYRSLMPLSQEARKPVFDLKPADGAFGGHQAAVGEARRNFRDLVNRILVEIDESKESVGRP